MIHKIFLSHNYNDKPLVEKVALKLAAYSVMAKCFTTPGQFVPATALSTK